MYLKIEKLCLVCVSMENMSLILTKAWFIQLEVAFNCTVMLNFLRFSDNLRRSYILCFTFLTSLICKNYHAFWRSLRKGFQRYWPYNHTNTLKIHWDTKFVFINHYYHGDIIYSWEAMAEPGKTFWKCSEP